VTRRTLWRGLFASAGLGLGAAGLFFFWPHGLPPVTASAAQPRGTSLVERGRYLTVAADCAACHTVDGGRSFAGGLAFKLPFGTIYSPNITPDRQHGIGAWSDAEFVRAMKSGIGRHGEDLYPAFPYTSYALLSTDDILAIRAYLATLAPASTPSPANALAFPFNQRRVMRGWKLLFLTDRQFAPSPAHDARWNRGAYIVEGLAHCGECHTPRNLAFARKQGEPLSGGDVDGWKAWNITSDKATGLGRWSSQDIASYLSTGHAPGHGSATGGMRQAIDLSLSKLTLADIDAMVVYLRSVAPVSRDTAAAVGAEAEAVRASGAWHPAGNDASLGGRTFAGACASCHGWNGKGQQTARASLSGSHAVNDPEGANLVRVILEGSAAPSDVPSTAMPAFGKAYTDVEVAAVSNYVIRHFSGKTGSVTPRQVRKARVAP
jgi:mono/diheme cytochrome c family protein